MAQGYFGVFIGNTLEVNHLIKKPTLVVGAGQTGSMLIRQMLKSDEMKLEPVLAVDDDEHKRNITITEGVKVQGEIADIPELVRKYKIKKSSLQFQLLVKSV